MCAVTGREYTIYGYKGKQVRDQIHSHDVARLFLEFYAAPRCGEVYNLGGGRANGLSILETIDLLECLGYKANYSYDPANRIGDHICYISDLTKVRSHFPNWQQEYRLGRIVEEMIQHYAVLASAEGKRRA
jgi:CDP-paratose 2-epimerase